MLMLYSAVLDSLVLLGTPAAPSSSKEENEIGLAQGTRLSFFSFVWMQI